VKPVALRSPDETDEVAESDGLLGGLTAWHFRLLTENPWEGGAGYTLEQVGKMTLDQIWSRLCDLNLLKEIRTETTSPLKATPKMEDGYVIGRDKDGGLIRGKIRGKSRARELMELKEKKQAERRKRRRKRRK